MAEFSMSTSVNVSPGALREERELAQDAVAQERAGAVPRPTGVLSPGWVHATHPEHGQPVVFVAGEMLPQWVLDQWDRAKHDVRSRVWTIQPLARRRAPQVTT